jgi:hypothetical protein
MEQRSNGAMERVWCLGSSSHLSCPRHTKAMPLTFPISPSHHQTVKNPCLYLSLFVPFGTYECLVSAGRIDPNSKSKAHEPTSPNAQTHEFLAVVVGGTK